MLRKRITEYVPMEKIIPMINAINADDKIPYEASNLVYPTRSDNPNKLDILSYWGIITIS